MRRTFVRGWGLVGLALLVLGCSESHAPSLSDEEEVFIDLVSPSVDGVLPELAPPIPEAELADLVEGFDWSATEPLEELDADGSPALHYVLIRVATREQFELLESAEVHWSPLPFWGEAREEWAQRAGVLLPGNEGVGTFVFALMPGQAYNVVRQGALDGDALFSAIVALDVPADAVGRGSGNWISLLALHSAGTCYRPHCDREAVTPDTDDDGVSVSTEPLFEDLRDISARFAEGILLSGFSFSLFIGQLENAFSATRDIRVQVFPHIADPDFGVAGRFPPTDRVWGPNRRLPLRSTGGLTGVVVWMFEVRGAGMWTGTLGADGDAVVRVPLGRTLNICLWTRSPDATVTADLVPTFVCGAVPANTNFSVATLALRDGRVDALTLAGDANQYLRTMVGQVPTRHGIIAVGNLANAIGLINQNLAFAPGLGGRDLGTRVAIAGFETILLPTPGAVVAPIIAVDVVIPDAFINSRIVVAHELGHLAFYQLMVAASPSPERYAQQLLSILAGTLASAAGGGPVPGDEQLVLNEAFADWFAVQLAGGANRLFGPGAPPPRVYRGDIGAAETYCDTLGPGRPAIGCMEFNSQGTGLEGTPFNQQVTRMSTIMFDFFDGPPLGPFTVHNGTAWNRLAGPACRGRVDPCPSDLVTLTGGPNGFDENVAVPLQAMLLWLQLWLNDPFEGNVLTEDTLMHAATRMMRVLGVPDAAICALYALHTPGGGCPGFWMAP